MIDIWNKNLNKLMCLQKLIETWTNIMNINSKIENYKHEKQSIPVVKKINVS